MIDKQTTPYIIQNVENRDFCVTAVQLGEVIIKSLKLERSIINTVWYRKMLFIMYRYTTYSPFTLMLGAQHHATQYQFSSIFDISWIRLHVCIKHMYVNQYRLYLITTPVSDFIAHISQVSWLAR